jgi:hypothetical protein
MTIDTDSSRRRFFFKAGAALSAPLAAGTVVAGSADSPGSATAAVETLRDIEAIRKLQQNLAREINAGTAERAAAHFVRLMDATTLAGIRRLTPADFGETDLIEIEPDGLSARARFHCKVETETPIEAGGTLVEMARQQGEGFVRRCETRVLEADYSRRDGCWKIEQLRFVDV